MRLSRAPRVRTLLPLSAAAAAVALGGCAAAQKDAPHTTAQAPSNDLSADASPSAGSAVGSGGSGMGSRMGGASQLNMKSTTVLNAKGVPVPVPIKVIDRTTWKDMAITAEEMTPVPFWVDNGTTTTEMKPAKNASFHLMVMLDDIHYGYAIPYSNVWAEIFKNGKRIVNAEQWPMISEYMGFHYGNNVSLPGPGTYKLTLLVSAPEVAMHREYANMWSGTHTVNTTFTWK